MTSKNKGELFTPIIDTSYKKHTDDEDHKEPNKSKAHEES